MLTRAAHRFSILPLPEVQYPAPHREDIFAASGEVLLDDLDL
jgi:hypothetical protein